MGADVTNPTGVAGRSVIVTGAGRGLGLDYARMYATEGARVALVDIQGDLVKSAVEMLSADLPEAELIGLEVDVTDRRSTAAMGEEVISSFGTIEILVNNAGIWGDLQPAQLIATDPDYWDLVMNVNLRGALLCAQAVIAPMRKQRWGRIINISSMGAYMPSGVYGVSKLGLNQLTYALSTEVGVDGITVNAVAPGPIDNEATRSQLPEKAMQKMIDGTAMKRMGTSERPVRDAEVPQQYRCRLGDRSDLPRQRWLQQPDVSMPTHHPDEEEFRRSVHAFLAEHAEREGWMRDEYGRAPSDDAPNEVRLARNRRCLTLLHEAGLGAISWPTEYGGQGLTNRHQVIFNHEVASYSLPLGMFIIGHGMCAPTLLAYGTDDQKHRHLPPLLRGRRSGASSSPNPEPGPTWPPFSAVPNEMATTGSSPVRRCGRPVPTTRRSDSCWPGVIRAPLATPA